MKGRGREVRGWSYLLCAAMSPSWHVALCERPLVQITPRTKAPSLKRNINDDTSINEGIIHYLPLMKWNAVRTKARIRELLLQCGAVGPSVGHAQCAFAERSLYEDNCLSASWHLKKLGNLEGWKEVERRQEWMTVEEDTKESERLRLPVW